MVLVCYSPGHYEHRFSCTGAEPDVAHFMYVHEWCLRLSLQPYYTNACYVAVFVVVVNEISLQFSAALACNCIPNADSHHRRQMVSYTMALRRLGVMSRLSTLF